MLFWIIIGTLASFVLLAGVGRFLLRLRSEPALRGLPTTPIQRLAWIGVAVSLAVGAGLAVLTGIRGVSGLDENPALSILVMGGVSVWLVARHRTNRRRGGAVVDERDRAILARSLSVESMIVLLSLVTWTITLTEVFRQDGAVPIAYLQLLFWSTFVAGIFGRSLGIILGYRQGTTPNA
jgi:hypothetical protein